MILNLLPFWVFLTRCKNKLFSLLIKKSFFNFGSGTVLEMPYRVSGWKNISLGSDVYIGSDSWLSAMPDFDSKIDRGNDRPIITLDRSVGITGHCTISAVKSVVIENEVLIARYVYISDHTHEYSDKSTSIKHQGVKNVKPVLIKKGTWIGQGAVICPGVTLGENCVVGANSVVNKSFPSYSVISGNPAKLIKTIS